MTGRERVLAAVNHQPYDRVALDLGSTTVTGLTATAYRALREELGLGTAPVRTMEPSMMVAEMEADIISALGVDAVGLCLGGGHFHGWQPFVTPDGTDVELSKQHELRPRDDGGWDQFCDGERVLTMPEGGLYFDPVSYAKWRDYDAADLTDELLADIERRARLAAEGTDLAVVLTLPYAIFNGTSPEFLMALAAEKDEAHERLSRWVDHILQCLRLLLDAVRDTVSIMVFSGDAGTQKAPIIGPDLYREMILPHMRRIPALLHEDSDIKFFYHSCGSVYRLIECFIEMGADILNPLQVTAAEMEPERLVAEYGGRIAFWGGGCDTQRVLPRGTQEQVREEVRSRLAHYASVPGFVFSQVHNIQADVPARNVLAMLDEVRRWTRTGGEAS